MIGSEVIEFEIEETHDPDRADRVRKLAAIAGGGAERWNAYEIRNTHLSGPARKTVEGLLACKVAHPPYVGFIARLRPNRFPGSDARQLSSPTNIYLTGSFPHW